MSAGVLLIGAGQTIVWAGLFYVFPAMLLQWEQALGWSKPELTAAFSIAILASAAFAPLAGRMIDMGYGRVLMAGSTLMGSMVLLALSSIHDLWQFYVCWVLLGCACAGCLYESCFAVVTRALGDGAKRAIVRITLMAGFAGSLSFPAVHFLSASWDWRVTLQIFSAVVCLLGTPLIWFGASAIETAGGSADAGPKKSGCDQRGELQITGVFMACHRICAARRRAWRDVASPVAAARRARRGSGSGGIVRVADRAHAGVRSRVDAGA